MNNNGSVYRRNDGRWVAKYRDADGKWRYIYRKTKAEAKKALRDALNDVDRGIKTTNTTRLTVKDVLTNWLEESEHEVSERTLSHRESLIRVHFLSHPIAGMKLTDLANDDRLRAYLKSKKHLAPSTQSKLRTVLKHVGEEGVRLCILRNNPALKLKPTREEHRELDILSPDQIKRLLKSVQGHRYELIVVLGATCGLRVGEALGMRWEDIDLERGTLEVKRTIWRSKALSPKTRTSRRTLKLPQMALEALRRRHERSSGYLCPTSSGNPTADSNFHNQWKAMLESAGLPRSTTFHSLRHGAASLLLNQSVPIPVVSKYLGHANPAITMRVYAHMIDGMGGMAADGMDDALG